ncbi:hypothetical protein L1987_76149 [Smallanthus sonchifolius]|uniref:Uncharacterized protein n=1 Tax=Smallanthus sonchifolius TaxID=185202 RepID=A0ACB9A8G9_9ASTR|nr:hypothetical protein L1987_76149 [Smallanthus sonchifolius]
MKRLAVMSSQKISKTVVSLAVAVSTSLSLITMYFKLSYKKNEKKEVGVNAFLPTAEAIEVVKHSMQGDDNVGVALLTYPVLMTLDRCPDPGP